MIAREVAGLALDPAFFVRFRGREKSLSKPPVRAESDEQRGTFPAKAA
jgi:hypothetical protein